MLLEDEELKQRMDSPLNLMNRLRNATNPRAAHNSHNIIPALPPSSDEVIEDLEEKITTGTIKGKAQRLMSDALDIMKERLVGVDKPEKLAKIAESMAKVIDSTEPRQNQGDKPAAQIIIYAPSMMTEDAFGVIEIND